MGCNFYVQYEEQTGWFNQTHIGKSSLGWKFLFRGFENQWHMAERIESKKDWQEFIDRVDGKIFDEYHRPVDDFWSWVEQKQGEMNHLKKAKEDGYFDDDYWQDDEGYDFCGHSFS